MMMPSTRSVADADADDADHLLRILDWSAKQSRILTADGSASTYYAPERGFPFLSTELPHHHLRSGSSHEAFALWAKDAAAGRERRYRDDLIVVGAWRRPLFAGSWEHSTDADEAAFNVQAGTLFVDVRIPEVPAGPLRRMRRGGSVSGLSDGDLRIYARRHAFGGYALIDRERRPPLPTIAVANGEGRTDRGGGAEDPPPPRQPVCTRHHVIDWNYLPSLPRDRPNKWWIELPPPETERSRRDVWKELSYATDEFMQHYYYERWERLDGDCRGEGLVLAMRKTEEYCCRDGGRDGILVVVGDHFNYIYGRTSTSPNVACPSAKSVVDLVDQAIKAGDRRTAEAYLSIDAGHGTLSSGWKIDCSIQPWREGTALFTRYDDIRVEGQSLDLCHILWNSELWEILECSGVLDTSELEAVFQVDRSIEDKVGSRL